MTRPPVRLGRVRLVALALIAFAPILIATALFYFPAWAPRGTTNEGELIVPPVVAATISADLSASGNWTLLQPAGPDCNAACAEMLYLSRQVTTGLGRDASRVRRVVIAPRGLSAAFAALLEAEHRDVRIISARAGPLEAISDAAPLLFLMDPNGNVMMFYTLDKAGKPMLKDLKHLLKVSGIG